MSSGASAFDVAETVLAISAILYSKPSGRSILTLCFESSTGLRIGWMRLSAMLPIRIDAFRPSSRHSPSLNRRHASSAVSHRERSVTIQRLLRKAFAVDLGAAEVVPVLVDVPRLMGGTRDQPLSPVGI